MTLITEGWGGDGAVMVTASHMPSEMNGLKMMLPSGGLEHAQLDSIVELAESGDDLKAPGGSESEADFLPTYRKLLGKRINEGLGVSDPQPLKGLPPSVPLQSAPQLKLPPAQRSSALPPLRLPPHPLQSPRTFTLTLTSPSSRPTSSQRSITL